MSVYTSYSTRVTPQSEPIPGRNMVKNEAGGYSFPVDKWVRLDRFLILGTEAGAYYVGARELTRQNADNILACLREDGLRTVSRIVEISENKRAPKNEPALFALAVAAGEGDLATRRAALEALPRVARIPTHLFSFLTYVQQFRGWGRGLVRAVQRVYDEKDLSHLAYQVVKYRQRGGWTHRDVLRKAHPKTSDPERNALFHWITHGEVIDGVPDIVAAYEMARRCDPAELPSLIREYNLPRECVPSEYLNRKDVWEALLERMPDVALVRNLGKMTQVGLIEPFSEATEFVQERLARLRDVHPWQILLALVIYKDGTGRSGLTWSPVSQIVDALDAAFYRAFKYVEPTGKRICLAIDVSGSMGASVVSKSAAGMRAAQAAAALSLIAAATESNHMFMAYNTSACQVSLSPRQRLDDVTQSIQKMIGGGTDCASPITLAIDKRIPVDAFVILTDEQTWYGRIHPVQAIEWYRQAMNIPARLIVVNMCAYGHSILDLDDALSMRVVGMDTHTPSLISEFVKE